MLNNTHCEPGSVSYSGGRDKRKPFHRGVQDQFEQCSEKWRAQYGSVVAHIPNMHESLGSLEEPGRTIFHRARIYVCVDRDMSVWSTDIPFSFFYPSVYSSCFCILVLGNKKGHTGRITSLRPPWPPLRDSLKRKKPK